MVTSISCINRTESVNDKGREIVVYSKCSSEEASSDLLLSINEIKDQLSKKSISVKIDDKKRLCGYLLGNETKAKKVTGALTDIEMLQEVNRFF